MAPFCLLKDPDRYVAQDWNLTEDAEARDYWLDLFRDHFEIALGHAMDRYGPPAQRRIEPAREEFSALIDRLREDPAALGNGEPLTVLALCRQRERVLRGHGMGDPFGHIKDRENESAAELYPQIVRELHAMEDWDKWLHLVECVFAGNLFDLGSSPTMHLAHKPVDFLATVEDTRPRPWKVDDFDRLWEDLQDAPPTKWARAVVFVDNAGSDFILGVMPLVRELALGGTQIVLAANEQPSLNDVTADETVEIVQHLSTLDRDLAALIEGQMFEVVSTGNDIPLIDLGEVSDELNEAAADADLVILEGMGRAVESNFTSEFKVDALRLALLKDPKVAERIGAELYDCVCKYTPAAS